MSYHELSECTLSPKERFDEKNEILEILEAIDPTMTDSEVGFIASMTSASHVSVRQLFWLRDIKEKYV